ncbi:unnamed protein product [Clonostachys chloroleuca]|uniref:Small ribosomal subunit protein uS7m n=1 Tax=Clonostachys chloroleuca TaxID=1926264 RepID=A0AA35Q9M5_9HYPO|nr:unnamed protein product [Clonostachys chloroleuca]
MAARSKVWGACRALAIRSRPIASQPESFCAISRRQWYSNESNDGQPPRSTNISDFLQPESKTPVSSQSANPATDAAASSESGPEDRLSDQDLHNLFYGGRVAASGAEGGLTQAQEDSLYEEGVIRPPAEAEALVAQADIKVAEAGNLTPGFKFPLPTQPYPEDFNVKKRYHPVLDQLTRLLMKDGKLAAAQRNMSIIMNFLRMAPEPIYSPKFPLLPGTPPASHLPLNPVLYITIAIDSVAPLIKVRNIAGAAGGGRALEVPMPLAVRQRRRQAFSWILDVVEKKPSKGSGRKQFPQRVAEEIIAVIEGRSTVWDRRKIIHKQGTASRANAGSTFKGKKRM